MQIDVGRWRLVLAVDRAPGCCCPACIAGVTCGPVAARRAATWAVQLALVRALRRR